MIIFTDKILKGIAKISPFDAEIMIAELETAYETNGRYVEFSLKQYGSSPIIRVLDEEEKELLVIVGITGLYLCNMYIFGVIKCEGRIPLKVLIDTIKQYARK